MALEGEQRPIDAAQEIEGITAEAAELAEHIRDTQPQWTREQQLTQLISLIDDANDLAARTEMELDE